MKFALLALLVIIVVVAVPFQALSQPTRWPISEGGNGHWYEFFLGNTTWVDANAIANSMVFAGSPGHLATITSAEEQVFVSQLPTGYGAGGHIHIGGLQTPGSATGDGWYWVTGEPWALTNWCQAEPNDPDNRSDFLEMVIGNCQTGTDWYWNDTGPSWLSFGYLVEWEGGTVPVLPVTWGAVKALYNLER